MASDSSSSAEKSPLPVYFWISPGFRKIVHVPNIESKHVAVFLKSALEEANRLKLCVVFAPRCVIHNLSFVDSCVAVRLTDANIDVLCSMVGSDMSGKQFDMVGTPMSFCVIVNGFYTLPCTGDT